MSEVSVLKALSTYQNYKQHTDKLDSHPLSKESNWILQQMKRWYQEREQDINFDVFKDFCFFTGNQKINQEDREIYEILLDKIVNDGSGVADSIIHDWTVRDIVADAVYNLNSFLDGDTTIDSIGETIQSISRLDEGYVDDKHLKTFANFNYKPIEEGSHKWRLSCLNDCSAGMSAGDLGIVFGRPNSGKTSFIVSETSQMFDKPGNIIWLNNEEAAERIMLRYISCIEQEASSHIEKNWEVYVDKYKSLNLVCLDKPSITKGDVIKVLDNNKPSVIVFNNLDKIVRRHTEATHKELGLLYQWARELAKEYAVPIFAVCQCSAEGEGKKVLHQSMLQDSKTDKAGEADVIIGIGRAEGEDVLVKGAVNRYINVCKNKLPEGKIEGLREVYGRAVSFYPRTGLYLDENKETYE